MIGEEHRKGTQHHKSLGKSKLKPKRVMVHYQSG